MRSMPVRRIVVIDHHSSDNTLQIAAKQRCEVIEEDKGLGYARDLAFRSAETPVFAMVESDLVYDERSWYPRARSLLEGRVGAVVAAVTRGLDNPRGRYNEFWSRVTPFRGRRHGFSAGSTLFLREATRDIHVPPELNAYEDIYIMRKMSRRGWTYRWVEVEGMHYSDFSTSAKARWFGANARRLYSLDRGDVSLLRRNLLLPAKGLIAALSTSDGSILLWALTYSLAFLRGYDDPSAFEKLKR